MLHLLVQLIREEKLFSLEVLNNRITSYKYGSSEAKNKPTTIAPANLSKDGHLKQSGM